MPRVVLVRGLTYRAGSHLFRRGVEVDVDQRLYDHVMRMRPGKFADVNQQFHYIHPSHIPKYAMRGATITILRDVGLGDVVIVSRLLPALAAKYPKARFRFAVNRPYVDIFRNEPWETVAVDELRGECVVLDLRGYAERAHDRYIHDRLEVYLRYTGVWPIDHPAPSVTVLPETKEEVRGRLLMAGREESRPLVGLCLRDSGVPITPERPNALGDHAINRTMSYPQQRAMLDLLLARDYDVALIDHEAIGWSELGVLDMTAQMNFLQLGGLLALCDVVVGPDTGIYHYAHAVGTAIVVYFGKVHPSWRARWYEKCSTIFHPVSAHCPCEHKPCPTSDCVEAVTPTEVVALVDDWVERSRTAVSETVAALAG